MVWSDTRLRGFGTDSLDLRVFLGGGTGVGSGGRPTNGVLDWRPRCSRTCGRETFTNMLMGAGACVPTVFRNVVLLREILSTLSLGVRTKRSSVSGTTILGYVISSVGL